MSQLLKEGNRSDGTLPGFLPQHESEILGKYVPTGETNPHPVKVKEPVEVGNFPTQQDVSDKDVLAELRLLKAENVSIKEQNQQILETLKGTLDTQVTGNFVEDTPDGGQVLKTQLTGSNAELGVKVKSALGENRNIIDNRNAASIIPPNSGQIELFKTEKPYMLDYLEVATNHEDAIRLRIYHGQTQSLFVVAVDASESGGMTAKNINENASGLLDTLEYNTSRNHYKFRLRLPVPFLLGCRITVENTKATEQKMLLYGFGRELA